MLDPKNECLTIVEAGHLATCPVTHTTVSKHLRVISATLTFIKLTYHWEVLSSWFLAVSMTTC